MNPWDDRQELAYIRKHCLCEREVANALVYVAAHKARTCRREGLPSWQAWVDQYLKVSAAEEGESVTDYCIRNGRAVPDWAAEWDRQQDG